MSKYVLVAFIFIYFIIITTVANSIYIDTSQLDVVTDGNGWDLLDTFFSLLTFKVDEIPTILNAIFILPPIVALILVVADWIRGN